MRSIGTSIAEKDFEELLSAVWTAQVVQSRAPRFGRIASRSRFTKTTAREGDVR